MTPGQYLALARDAAILVVLAVILYFVYTAGKDHVGVQDLKGLQSQLAQTGQKASDWRDQQNASTTQLAADVAAIRAGSSAPVQHNWVLDTPPCQAAPVLPAPAREAALPSSAPGPVQPGHGPDVEGRRRDQIVAAFKERYETVLAQCRAQDAAWPQ